MPVVSVGADFELIAEIVALEFTIDLGRRSRAIDFDSFVNIEIENRNGADQMDHAPVLRYKRIGIRCLLFMIRTDCARPAASSWSNAMRNVPMAPVPNWR